MENIAGNRLTNSQYLKDPKKLDLLLGHLSEIQREDMFNLIHSFPDIMDDNPTQAKGVKHEIRVKSPEPIKQRAYKVSPYQREILKKEIDYLIANNLAKESESSWASPCILVGKPDGTYRMCTDFRKVNAVTIKDSYPIPLVDEIIDQVAGAKYLTKIDLLKGYYQVPMHENSREISAFITPFGLYEYTVMPFGLCNAPSTFQRYMNYVIKNMKDVYVYLDDIIVASNSWEEHIMKLKELFTRFRDMNLTINLAKCEFCKPSVKYLGHIVGQGKIIPTEEHVNAIQGYCVPTSKKDVMKFLGAVGYYRKFCRNFADVALPLTSLLRKNAKFEWTAECGKAFG